MDGPYLMTLLIEDVTNCCHDRTKGDESPLSASIAAVVSAALIFGTF